MKLWLKAAGIVVGISVLMLVVVCGLSWALLVIPHPYVITGSIIVLATVIWAVKAMIQ